MRFTNNRQPATLRQMQYRPRYRKKSKKGNHLPNTATGPSGIWICLISGLGNDFRSGIAVSMMALTHEPSVNNAANILN